MNVIAKIRSSRTRIMSKRFTIKMGVSARPTAWVSYGGGVNSTALAVLLVQGKFPQYKPFRFLWSDVQDEKPETYDYIFREFMPWLRKNNHTLEVIRPREGVLERSERLGCVIQRTVRRCTSEAKIRPIERYLKAFGRKGDVQLLGIDAAESHRAKEAYPTDLFIKRYPLIELDIDRDGCLTIIQDAGLPIPVKSGCWHCPFMRKAEVIELALNEPCKMNRIIALEANSNERQPMPNGRTRKTWGERSAADWLKMARGGEMFAGQDDEEFDCVCYDG